MIVDALVGRRPHKSHTTRLCSRPAECLHVGTTSSLADCTARSGIVKYLEEHYDLTKVHVRGASAGALLATLAACNVDPKTALDSAHRLALEAGLWDRKLKLAGVWGDLIRAWLYELLPANASDLVR